MDEMFSKLRGYARIIRDEKATSANTALRIGDMYLSIIDAMEEQGEASEEGIAEAKELTEAETDRAKGVEEGLTKIVAQHQGDINGMKPQIQSLTKGVLAVREYIDKLFTLDEATETIKTKYNFSSEKSIATKGVGSSSGGNGSSYGRLDNWDNYNPSNGDVLSALLGYGLKNDIAALTNKFGNYFTKYETRNEIVAYLNDFNDEMIVPNYSTKSEVGSLADLVGGLGSRVSTLEGKATTVSFAQTLQSGKQIGVLSIDGKNTTLFAPAGYAWNDIYGKPTTLAGYGITDALPVRGGIIIGDGADLLTIDRNDGNPTIRFAYNRVVQGRIGFDTVGNPVAQCGGVYQTIIHSGNYSSYALPLSGGTINGHVIINSNILQGLQIKSKSDVQIGLYPSSGDLLGLISSAIVDEKAQIVWGVNRGSYSSIIIKENANAPIFRSKYVNYDILHTGNYSSYALPLTGGMITGTLNVGNNISADGTGSFALGITAGGTSKLSLIHVGSIEMNVDGKFTTNGGYIDFHYGGSQDDYTSRIIENERGRISIYADTGVDVAGPIRINGNVGIGTTSPSAKLHVDGTMYATGDVTVGGKLKVGSILIEDKDGDLFINGNVAASGSVATKGIGMSSSGGSGTIPWSALENSLIAASTSYNLGSSAKPWGRVYANSGVLGTLVSSQSGVTLTSYVMGLGNTWQISANGSASFASLTVGGANVNNSISSLNNSITALQQSTFTGQANTNYYRLTWFTSSGGNRNVDIPTYQGKGFASIEDLDGVFMADYKMVYDILDYVDNKLGAYATTANTYTKTQANNTFAVKSEAMIEYSVSVTGDRNVAPSLNLDCGNGVWLLRNAFNGTNGDLKFLFDEQQKAQLTPAGDFTISGRLTQSSDETLKNILDYNVDMKVKDIANAPVCYFTWKDRVSERQIGTIAQYWKLITPECVVGEEGGMSMDYSTLGLVSSIVNAREIVKHDDEIEALKRRVKELESEIAALKAA